MKGSVILCEKIKWLFGITLFGGEFYPLRTILGTKGKIRTAQFFEYHNICENEENWRGHLPSVPCNFVSCGLDDSLNVNTSPSFSFSKMFETQLSSKFSKIRSRYNLYSMLSLPILICSCYVLLL